MRFHTHTLTLLTALLFGPLTSLRADETAQATKPNIIFIYADDWGWRISLDPTDGLPEIVMDNIPPGAEPYPVVHLIADPR